MTNANENSPLGERTRSMRLSRDLQLAFAGGRCVAITGHPGDILVAANGSLVRLAQWLALEEEGRGSVLLSVDPRRGASVLAHPDSPESGLTLNFDAAPVAQLLSEITDELAQVTRPTTIFIDFSCLEITNDDGTLLRLLLELPRHRALTRLGHRFVVVFQTVMPLAELQACAGWALVDIGLPELEERLFILRVKDQQKALNFKELDIEHLASVLGGLEADALIRLAEESWSGAPIDARRVSEVKAAEVTRISAGTIKVLDAENNELAGLWNLRYYVEGRRLASRPVGPILLAGPPGCGKTQSFLWLARQLGLPAVRLGQILDHFVGGSERNLARARDVLEAMAPICVLLDEVDLTGLGKRGTNLDSGVSDRMREGLLGLLNDASNTGIVFVLTTNNPAGIDAAGLDRVEVLPVLTPTIDESLEILVIEATKQRWVLTEEDARNLLLEHNIPMSGRTLVRLLHKAAVHAARGGHPGSIQATDFELAFERSLEVSDSLREECMALHAIAMTESMEAWPWFAAAQMGQTPQIPSYVTPLMTANGQIELTKLRARISELERSGHGF